MRKIKRMMFIFLFISVFLITSVQSSVPADGYGCLDNKIKNRGCNLLSTEEKVFSVLSTGECEEELLKNSEKNNSCWSRPGNTCDVKLTSQAYLALDEQGGVNEKIVKWISSKNKTADDIQWYLQINAPRNTNCSINTSSDNDYKIQIKNKEKIKEKSISPGSSPFSVSSEGYSIRIDKNYYNKDFSVSCDENFKASFLFEYDNSIYVSDITKFGSKNSPLELKVKSLSFNNYEETLWASIALRKGGKSISPFLPYLIVKEKENSEYIPESFLYYLTDDEDYSSKLISKQRSGGYWRESSNEFYDTAVALFPFINENFNTKSEAIDWLKTIRDDSGCWDNGDIVNTAFILFSVWPQYSGGTCGNGIIESGEECDAGNFTMNSCSEYLGSNYSGNLSCNNNCLFNTNQCINENAVCGDGEIQSGESCEPGKINDTSCSDYLGSDYIGNLSCNNVSCSFDTSECVKKSADLCESHEGFFCMSESACFESEGNIFNEYECKGWNICCDKEELNVSCDDIGGEICREGEACTGEFSDKERLSNCCLNGECKEQENQTQPSQETSECEDYFGVCKTECFENQTEVDYNCKQASEVCCIDKEKNNSWLWIILIILVLAALLFIFRKKIKKFYNEKIKKSNKKQKSKNHNKKRINRPSRPMKKRSIRQTNKQTPNKSFQQKAQSSKQNMKTRKQNQSKNIQQESQNQKKEKKKQVQDPFKKLKEIEKKSKSKK